MIKRVRVCCVVLFVPLFALTAVSALAQPCTSPSAPTFLFTPSGNVGADETYALAWSDTTAGEDDYFVIERSTSSSFASLLDSQQVYEPAASFIIDAEGRYYHRVKAVPACNPALASGYSSATTVNVVSGAASVVVTVQPKPRITTLGESLAEKKTTIVLENVTKRPVTVIVTNETIGDSPNFFTLTDPEGGNLLNLTLEPRTPKTIDIEFDGFSTPVSTRRSYQGVVLVLSNELAVLPYAFVNLKVGGTESEAPYFRRDGLPVEYVFFPGFSGSNDAGRPPVEVEIVNPGGSSVEVGGEIGPELWLEPESGWNSDPIPAGGSIDVLLFTARERALTGSPLPRYTYLTIHTKGGETARLLVQDNDAVSSATGRTKLEKSERSLIVPGVISRVLGNGRRFYSIVSLANVGSGDLTAELFYTPDNVDGFTAGSVKRVEVVVPGNDVVRLTDPLSQVFGVSAPASGQIEVRAASGDVGFLSVSARTFTPAEEGVGGFGYVLPVAVRGEGAREDSPHVIPGVTVGSSHSAELILAETTGVDDATVRVRLYDSAGLLRGSRAIEVRRYGQTAIADLVTSLGGTLPMVAGRLDLDVTSGSASVFGTLLVRDSTYNGWTMTSQPSAGALSKRAAAAATRRIAWHDEMFVRRIHPSAMPAATSVQYVIGSVISGQLGSLPGSITTTVGVTSPGSEATSVTLTLVSSTGDLAAAPQTLSVPAGQTEEYADVVQDLFGLGGSFNGMILADSSNLAGLLYARLAAEGVGVTTTLVVPVVTIASPSLTGPGEGERRPVYVDGIEQSVSEVRGSKWALVLNEVSNLPVTVEVRLYEAGNRVVPIAKKDVSLGALEEARLDTIFSAMGLESALRNKDRINVMIVVSPKSGTGLVSAIAQGVDNSTGNVTSVRLTPSGGVPATGILLAMPIPDEPVVEQPKRRRPVRPR